MTTASTVARMSVGLLEGPEMQGNLLAVFRGYSEDRVYTFEEAMAPILEAKFPRQMSKAVKAIRQEAENRKTWDGYADIDVDALATLLMYTSDYGEPKLYEDMNQKCYNKNRKPLMPYVDFMWALLGALRKLPPCPQVMTVFRGVNLDLWQQYTVGKHFCWHGFVSTTTSLNVPRTFIEDGPGTMSIIQLSQGQGRDIRKFSDNPHEAEILLPPQCRFKVLSRSHTGDWRCPNCDVLHLMKTQTCNNCGEDKPSDDKDWTYSL